MNKTAFQNLNNKWDIMTEKPQTIVICMGSSCFSRGNRNLVRMIQDFLKEQKLEDEVTLKGAHCMSECDKGPVMKINEEVIYNVNEESLTDLLVEKLSKSSSS
ncbi:MAG: (2Fe-2S) ferredoxin domain-containing protein [Bacteroidales bacterium]